MTEKTNWEKQVIETVKATLEKKAANGDIMSVWPMVKTGWEDYPFGPMKEVNPEWCEIHQHHKWCSHNGGVTGPNGWQAPACVPMKEVNPELEGYELDQV